MYKTVYLLVSVYVGLPTILSILKYYSHFYALTKIEGIYVIEYNMLVTECNAVMLCISTT